MKRIFLWVAFFTLLPFAAAQRLPELAVPENYKLSFAPDFQKDNFAGEETIQLRVLKTTSQIVLNSAEIDFKKQPSRAASTTQKAKITLDTAERNGHSGLLDGDQRRASQNSYQVHRHFE